VRVELAGDICSKRRRRWHAKAHPPPRGVVVQIVEVVRSAPHTMHNAPQQHGNTAPPHSDGSVPLL